MAEYGLLRYGLGVGIAEDSGRQLRTKSEDAICKSLNNTVFVVADGMGGRKGSREASRIAALSVGKVLGYTEWGSSPEEYREIMEKALKTANSEIYHKGLENDSSGMGTTIAAALFRDDWMYTTHVGDSRIYKLDVNNELARLTEDHTPLGKAFANNMLTLEEWVKDPRKSVLTQYLGKSQDIEVKVKKYHIGGMRKVLLATDGLTDMATEQEMLMIIQQEGSPQEIAEQLVDLANYPQEVARMVSRLSEREQFPFPEKWSEEEAREMIGGRDNISAMVIEVDHAMG